MAVESFILVCCFNKSLKLCFTYVCLRGLRSKECTNLYMHSLALFLCSRLIRSMIYDVCTYCRERGVRMKNVIGRKKRFAKT